MGIALKTAVGLFSLVMLAIPDARAMIVMVDGRDAPWDSAKNPSFSYNESGSVGSALVAADPFSTYRISYLSGFTQTNSGYPLSDASGCCVAFGPTFDGPGQYTTTGASGLYPDLQALLGAFVDGSGTIIGHPFFIGDGPVLVTAPAGTVDLSLGVNDTFFSDNLGSLQVSVSAVPEPSSWAMMILGFLGIGALAFCRRQSGLTA
jgi:hypothetical protein